MILRWKEINLIMQLATHSTNNKLKLLSAYTVIKFSDTESHVLTVNKILLVTTVKFVYVMITIRSKLKAKVYSTVKIATFVTQEKVSHSSAKSVKSVGL